MNYTTEVTDDNKLIVSFPDLNGILIWNGSLEGFQKAFFENILQPSGKITESGKFDFEFLRAFNKSFLSQSLKKPRSIAFHKFEEVDNINGKLEILSQIESIKTTKSFNSDFGVFTLEYENGKPIKVLNENVKFLHVISLAIENETIDRVLSKYYNIVEIDLPKYVIKEDNERVDFDFYTKLNGDVKFQRVDLDNLNKNYSKLFKIRSDKFVVEYVNGKPINITGENKKLIDTLNTSILNGSFESVFSDPYLNVFGIEDFLENELGYELEKHEILSTVTDVFISEDKKEYSGGRAYLRINGIITLIEQKEEVDNFQFSNKLVIQHSEDRNSEFYMLDLSNFVQSKNLQAGNLVTVDFYINCEKTSKNVWFNNFVIKSIRKI